MNPKPNNENDTAPVPGAGGLAPLTNNRSETFDDQQVHVNDVFDQVAERYDLMNDLMSAGLHRAWKSALVNWLAPPRNARFFDIIDVAGGTGDIAFRLLERAGPGCRVVVCDINPSMVEVGKRRAGKTKFADAVEFAIGNAEALGFCANNFDAYTIAFGIRNVPRMDQALNEAYRVLKPGGRFMCLEFSTVEVPGLGALYDAYSFIAIPVMGALVTGSAAPYRYLVDSIRQFPPPAHFSAMIAKAGFDRIKHRSLSGGIAVIHSAWKL